MPSLSTKNETKQKKHALKRAGLAPKKEKTQNIKHVQKENQKEVTK